MMRRVRGRATICRTLKFMGCTRQVIQHMGLQHRDDCRAAEVSVYDPAMRVWVDESALEEETISKDYVLSTDGIHDVYLYEGNVNGDIHICRICSEFAYSHLYNHSTGLIRNP